MTRQRWTWCGVGLLVGCVVGLLGPSAAGPVQDSDGVLHFDQVRVKAGFEKGGTLLKRDNYQVHTSFRDQGGLAEVHTRNTDVFYIVEGRATLVLGGKLDDPREAEPDELRGPSITGGVAQSVQAGEILVIPRGTPHWFKETSAPFRYLTVKVRES